MWRAVENSTRCPADAPLLTRAVGRRDSRHKVPRAVGGIISNRTKPGSHWASSVWRFKQLLAWRPNACNGHGRAIIAPGAGYVKRKMPAPGVLGGGAAFGVRWTNRAWGQAAAAWVNCRQQAAKWGARGSVRPPAVAGWRSLPA